MPDKKITHLHRPFIAPDEIARAARDPDALYRRHEGEPVDLYEWLNRRRTWRDDLRDLGRDILDFSHVLTIGIVIGALATVGFAYICAAVLL